MLRVVIVNFNAGQLLRQCLMALAKTPVPLDIVIIDNGSTDGSLQAVSEVPIDGVQVINNEVNRGFAGACNQGLQTWQGEFALLLNPDCLVAPDVIPGMLTAMRDTPQAGMAGCLILNPDGSEQKGCRRATPTPERLFWQGLGRDQINLAGGLLPGAPIEVEAISGAFMLVRRAAWEEVGLLDEGYFMHWEDLDWCYRFRLLGWKILFVPQYQVTHIKGACSHRTWFKVEWHKHVGMVRFLEKFFRGRSSWLLRWGLYLGLVIRFVLRLPGLAWHSIRGA